MPEIALGVEGPDGQYREVEGGGYARAAAGVMAPFGPATNNWGVVRGVATVEGDASPPWMALPVPVFVREGDALVYDAHEVRLVKRPAVPAAMPTGTAPTLTARPHATLLRGGG